MKKRKLDIPNDEAKDVRTIVEDVREIAFAYLKRLAKLAYRGVYGEKKYDRNFLVPHKRLHNRLSPAVIAFMWQHGMEDPYIGQNKEYYLKPVYDALNAWPVFHMDLSIVHAHCDLIFK